uniref:SNF2_N domain-containing protein n=1 Tax=Macrostomum lignano TaxID=282301 RepID=A0A1I8I831_9PLAT
GTGTNLALEVVAMPSLRRYIFYLAVKRPEEFPTHTASANSAHKFERHLCIIRFEYLRCIAGSMWHIVVSALEISHQKRSSGYDFTNQRNNASSTLDLWQAVLRLHNGTRVANDHVLKERLRRILS